MAYLEAVAGDEPGLAVHARDAVLVSREGAPDEPQERHDEHGDGVERPQQPVRRIGRGRERLHAQRHVEHVQQVHAVRQVHEVRLLLPASAHGAVERVRVPVHRASPVVVDRHEQAEVRVHLRMVQRMVPAPQHIHSTPSPSTTKTLHHQNITKIPKPSSKAHIS
jgi:hypothetical protein